MPARLAAELARVAVEAQTAWEAARAASDFAGVRARTSRGWWRLKRAEADCLAAEGRGGYDALLDDYEPGTTAAELERLFGRLRPGLAALRARDRRGGAAGAGAGGALPARAAAALSRRLGDVFGYDWAAGRLDIAVHPSSSGSGGDVRITTRIDEADPRECIYATIHEVGHAVYEQGLDPTLALLPAGAHASMGVHESQSRLFENQLGRSRAFCGWLWPALRAAFGELRRRRAEGLYRAVNAVETGFIRTEADEVHYNLHVMMRFDLERALIGGDLAVARPRGGVERPLRRRFRPRGAGCAARGAAGRALVGRAVRLLPDLHARQHLRRRAPRRAAPRPARPRRPAGGGRPRAGGRLAAPAIHRRGRLLAPRALIAEACGREPEAATLLGQLEAKYGELYLRAKRSSTAAMAVPKELSIGDAAWSERSVETTSDEITVDLESASLRFSATPNRARRACGGAGSARTWCMDRAGDVHAVHASGSRGGFASNPACPPVPG